MSNLSESWTHFYLSKTHASWNGFLETPFGGLRSPFNKKTKEFHYFAKTSLSIIHDTLCANNVKPTSSQHPHDNSSISFRAAKDPCSPNPCHHGGHCLSHSEVDYECECGKGYTGVKCESKSTYLMNCLQLLHTVWNDREILFTLLRGVY